MLSGGMSSWTDCYFSWTYFSFQKRKAKDLSVTIDLTLNGFELHWPSIKRVLNRRLLFKATKAIMIIQGWGRLEMRPPVARESYPELFTFFCPPLHVQPASTSTFGACCFVLLTRGWGRLQTRPSVAMGSSPELSAFTRQPVGLGLSSDSDHHGIIEVLSFEVTFFSSWSKIKKTKESK